MKCVFLRISPHPNLNQSQDSKTYRFNRVERLVAEPFDAGEPLVGRAENGGLLGSPVVRVLVVVILREQQRPLLLERANDGRIPIPKDIHAREPLTGFRREPSQVVDGREQIQPVLQPGKIVLLSMTRR